MKERQLEGIAKSQLAGVYKGRLPSIDGTEIKALQAEDLSPVAIVERLDIGRALVYR